MMNQRPNVPEMDALLEQEFNVLDKGFVRVVDYMGDDAAIAQAARVSYGKGTKTAQDDRGLIRYLMRHWHTTPFEMCELKLHVKLPVFVARQWIRHRTANVNEYSARYSILDKEFYFPHVHDMAAQSTTNNQGRGELIDPDMAKAMLHDMQENADGSYQFYDDLLGDGLSREIARMNLPANIYTQWYWKVDLHNLFHFLRLRADPHAQLEIRHYANVICEIVKAWLPVAYEAFEDYRLEAEQFSRMEMEILRKFMSTKGKALDLGTTMHGNPGGMSDREMVEFKQKLGMI